VQPPWSIMGGMQLHADWWEHTDVLAPMEQRCDWPRLHAMGFSEQSSES
jgi:hypothetical protein